jgi:PIN domain nuclease of toxin-antitoxin system
VTVLLDTHTWLWMLGMPGRMNAAARELVDDARTTVLLSAVTSWEIAIKYALGRLRIPDRPERYVPDRMRATGVVALPVDHSHALRVSVLELHHSDPFDRLLIAQAQVERVPLLTADRVFDLYDVEVIPAA